MQTNAGRENRRSSLVIVEKQPAGRRFLLVHLIWLVKGLSENVPASAEPRSANFEYRSDSKDSDATARPVQEHFL